MAGMEVWTQQLVGRGMGVVVRSDGFLSRLAVAGCAVWFYFWKLIWPVNLIFVYPRWQIDRRNLLVLSARTCCWWCSWRWHGGGGVRGAGRW